LPFGITSKVLSKNTKANQWDITLTAIKAILARYDNVAANNISTVSKLDIICPCGQYMIVKLNFTIAGSNVSAKSSGNRVIAAVETVNKIVKNSFGLFKKTTSVHPTKLPNGKIW